MDDYLFKKEYQVSLSDVDFTKKMKLSALLNCFQDIAGLASDQHNVGVSVLEKENLAWVLVRFYLHFERIPTLDEIISIGTWHQEARKFEIDRSFVVYDQSGSIIVKAISTWVIMDKASRKIQKLGIFGERFPRINKPKIIDYPVKKLKDFGSLEQVYLKTVGYSDVDFNGHLNNSKYIDYIMDCFNLESHKKYQVKSIMVNFLTETLPGETMALYKDTSDLNDQLVYIEGVKLADDKIIFKSQLEIRKTEIAYVSRETLA